MFPAIVPAFDEHLAALNPKMELTIAHAMNVIREESAVAGELQPVYLSGVLGGIVREFESYLGSELVHMMLSQILISILRTHENRGKE